MKIYLTGLVLSLLLFPGCEKSDIVQLDLKGTLKGEIYTVDEFGFQNSDDKNITVQLEGSDPLLSTLTDDAGRFEIKGIPTGTYNLIISKEGYGEYQEQGFQIAGGNEPLYFSVSIFKKSSITIENFSVEIVNNTEIYLRGIVNHNFDMVDVGFRTPTIKYFIHTSDNPSNNNYLQAGTVNFMGESGSQLNSQIYPDKNLFPSGSKIYIIAYGCDYYDFGYYDIQSNKNVYTTVGAGSDLVNILVP